MLWCGGVVRCGVVVCGVVVCGVVWCGVVGGGVGVYVLYVCMYAGKQAGMYMFG